MFAMWAMLNAAVMKFDVSPYRAKGVEAIPMKHR